MAQLGQFPPAAGADNPPLERERKAGHYSYWLMNMTL